MNNIWEQLRRSNGWPGLEYCLHLFVPVEPCWLPLNSSTSGKKRSFVLPCRILEGNWKGMCGKKTHSSNQTGCKRMCQKSNVLFILLFYMLHLHNTLQLERKPLSIEAHAENGFGQTQSKFQRTWPKDNWHVLIILDGILPCLCQKFYNVLHISWFQAPSNGHGTRNLPYHCGHGVPVATCYHHVIAWPWSVLVHVIVLRGAGAKLY